MSTPGGDDQTRRGADAPAEAGVPVLGALSANVLAEMFRHLPDAVVVADLERRIVYANPATETLFGYAAGELLGNTTSMLYASADDYAEQGRRRYNAASTSSLADYRVLYRRADGTNFLGVTNGGPMRGDDGRVKGFVGIIQPARSHDKALDALQRLHRVNADTSLTHAARIDALLAIGAEHYGLPLAIQSRMHDDEYVVEHCRVPDGGVHPGDTFALAETYCAHALAADRPVGFHHARESEIRTHPCYRAFGLEAYVGSPVRVDGEVYGTVSFSSFTPSEPFSRDDLTFMQLLADTIAFHIAERALRDELRELAERDDLTGLPRRRAILRTLDWHLSYARRTGQPVTVAILDLDHFKRINDTYGHAVGDKALIAFAEIAGGIGREIDTCGRIGGEEFLLVLPGTDALRGAVVAERLRRQLLIEPVDVGTDESLTIAFSAGVASFDFGETAEQLMSRADAALYEAKDAGRGCVRIDQGAVRSS